MHANFVALILLTFMGCNKETKNFRDRIWREGSGVAVPVSSDEVNDIVVMMSRSAPHAISVVSSDPELEVTARDQNRLDVKLSFGTFRFVSQGDSVVSEAVVSQLSTRDSDSRLLSRCYLMPKSSEDGDLWFLRSQIYPGGFHGGRAFGVFNVETKSGFFLGSPHDNKSIPASCLTMFDKTGEFAVWVIPVKSEEKTWDILRNRLVLDVDEIEKEGS